jgi:hypothetical protein
MFCAFCTLLIGLGGLGALIWLAGQRLKGRPEAARALAEVITALVTGPEKEPESEPTPDADEEVLGSELLKGGSDHGVRRQSLPDGD